METRGYYEFCALAASRFFLTVSAAAATEPITILDANDATRPSVNRQHTAISANEYRAEPY